MARTSVARGPCSERRHRGDNRPQSGTSDLTGCVEVRLNQVRYPILKRFQISNTDIVRCNPPQRRRRNCNIYNYIFGEKSTEWLNGCTAGSPLTTRSGTELDDDACRNSLLASSMQQRAKQVSRRPGADLAQQITAVSRCAIPGQDHHIRQRPPRRTVRCRWDTGEADRSCCATTADT